MKSVILLTLFAAFIVLTSCDDKNSVPESVQEATAKAQEQAGKNSKHPTTQELLHGPRIRLTLAPLPFSVQVPSSWKIENLSGATFLTGPTPSADIQLQLSNRAPVKKDELDVIERAAKRELATSQPGIKHVVKADFRKLGNVQVFERQAIGQPGPLIVTDEKNIEHTVTATPFDWQISLYVPQSGENYAHYELNFIALSYEQYQQDKPLLESVINSLAYEPSAAPSTQPF